MESVNYLLSLISKYKIATLDARASTSVNHISTSGLAILVAEQSYQAICIHWIIVIYFCTHNCANNVRIQRGHENYILVARRLISKCIELSNSLESLGQHSGVRSVAWSTRCGNMLFYPGSKSLRQHIRGRSLKKKKKYKKKKLDSHWYTHYEL